MKLETELRDQFMEQAQACQRSASQIIREMMRDFVQKQHESREYEAFLQQKAQLARASMEAQHGPSHEAIEAEFAARRARASRLE